MTTELLSNHLGGRWQAGTGTGTALFDPVLGTELVRVDATGLDLKAGFAFARQQGGAALRALTYRQRGELLAAAAKVLQANRDAYYEISTANSGTVKSDSGVDVDGAIYTLGTYAKLAASLPDGHFLPDGEAQSLAKDGSYPSGHAALGWAWAQILASLAPERADALLRRGYAFGQSRMVCGYHWQSDVDQGRLVGSAAVARLQSDPVFSAQARLARQEIAAARARGLQPVASDCAAETLALNP